MIGYNIWDLFERGDKNPIHFRINGSELKLINSYKRFKSVFKNKLKFQKENWGTIDNNKPFGTRLSYHNSDDISF